MREGTAFPAPDGIAARVRADEAREARPLSLVAAMFFIAMLIFAVVGWQRGDVFYQRLASEALIYGGLALSVDILLGFAGLLSLGQALYFGLGAYAAALTLKYAGPNFWLAMGAAALIGFVSGSIGGLIVARVRGVYFALITFGLAAVVSKVVYNTRELGASDGIIGIPVVDIPFAVARVRVDDPTGFLLVTLGFVAIVYALLVYLSRTPWGRIVSALRVNEHRLAFIGFAAGPFRFGTFVLASVIASLSGGLYPVLRGFVSPELMYFDMSTSALIAVIIGGTGTLIGPLVGVMLLVFARSVIGTYTEHHLIVIGVLFMLAVIFFPRGLVGGLRRMMQRKPGDDDARARGAQI